MREAPTSVDNTAVATDLSIVEDTSTSERPAAGYKDANLELSAATFFLEQAIGRDFSLRNDAELKIALLSLRGVIDRNEFGVDGPSRIMAENAFPGDVQPEWEQVRAVLQRAEGSLSISFIVPKLIVHTQHS